MDLNHDVFDERGVSPVIGVILMVAITVILAGVIGAFVMNMDVGGETQPSVQWEWSNDTDAGHIELSHSGGNAVVAGEMVLNINGNETGIDAASAYDADDELTAGDTVTFNASTAGTTHINVGVDPSDIDEIQLIWENPTSDQTQVVSKYEP